MSESDTLEMLFFMIFLLAGGVVIGVNNYAYVSTHMFEVALVSLSSFAALSIALFWDEINLLRAYIIKRLKTLSYNVDSYFV